ncbi:hypothetical protein N9H12_00595 [Flavobacteriales bacterium]|nr:hypothetical protein [Flavobacteriales bacterium]
MIDFIKVTDIINSEGPICELYHQNNSSYWLKANLRSFGKHIFFRVSYNNLVDYLTDITNLAGMLNNSPSAELFLYDEKNGLNIVSKRDFDYKEIQCGNKLYSSINPGMLGGLKDWIQQN